jgi:hypothetical protein
VHQRQTLSIIQRDDPLDQPLAIILQPLHIRHEPHEKGALIIRKTIHRVLLSAPLFSCGAARAIRWGVA